MLYKEQAPNKPTGIGNSSTERGKMLPDPEELLKLWIELRTLVRVREKLRRDGIINPATKQPPSKQAINFAIWKWVVTNPKKALDNYILPMERQRGNYDFSQDDWEEMIIRHAKAVFAYSNSTYMRWLKHYGLEEKAKIVNQQKRPREEFEGTDIGLV